MDIRNTPDLSSMYPNDLLSGLIQPREDWFRVADILGLIPELLSAFDRIGRPLAGADQLRQWLEEGGDEGLTARLEASHRGISGLITESPIHAMLLNLSSERNSPKRLELVALVLSLAEEWRAEFSGTDTFGYHDRVDGACRALRLLSEEGLDRVPDFRQDVEKFSETFRRRVDGLSSRVLAEGQIRYLKELERFFRYFLGEGPVVERALRGPRHVDEELTKGRWLREATSRDSEFDGHQEPKFFVDAVSKQALERQRLDGNAPDELLKSTVIVDPEESLAVKRGASSRHSIRRTGIKRVGLRRANRVLPGRWESLNEQDLRAFLQWIASDGNVLFLEKLLLLLILITGRSAQSIYDCRVVQNRVQLPDKIDPQAVYIILEEKAWASGVLKPASRRKKRNVWEPHLTTVSEVFIAPIPTQIWMQLFDPVWDAARQAKKRSVRLFGSHLNTRVPRFEKLLEESRECLMALRHAHGARLTLKRLESALFASLAVQFADTVEASLVTGSQPPFGQTAALYYQASPLSKLVDGYRQVVSAWDAFLPHLFSERGGAQERDDTPVGTPYVARESSIVNATTALRDELERLRGRGEPEAIREFHNLYTAYTHWMLLWSTGFRAVHDPVGRPQEINRRRGFVFIADKTGDGNAHHRAVPAPDRLLEQLALYERHCEAVRSRTYLMGAGANPHAFFLYLDEKLSIQPATPALLSSELERFFALPINVSRHSLRSFLRKHSVPGGLVNAFMGHWGIGAEPWARYSTLDPEFFRASVAPVLESLIDSLGFEVVYGIDGK